MEEELLDVHTFSLLEIFPFITNVGGRALGVYKVLLVAGLGRIVKDEVILKTEVGVIGKTLCS